MSTKFKKSALALSVLFAFPTLITPTLSYAQTSTSQQQQLTKQQLSSLVAPIALYPDSLVSQLLMASTYPVEIAEAYQWYQGNKNLTGSSLENALKGQQWDPSVKSIVHFPQVIEMMGSKLQWTQELGQAVINQQSQVLAAIQDLRAKAQANGNLESNQQQTVSTQGSGNTQVIVIQPTNPQVVYVPTYNPTVVYGGWPYPSYPPVSYYPPGYVAGTALLSFGVGMAVGAALWGGCHWGGGGWGGGGWGGGNSLTVNNNNFNNFNRNNVNNWHGGNNFQGGNWQHSGGSFNGFNSSNLNAARSNLNNNLSHDGFNSGNWKGGLNSQERNQADRLGNEARDANRFNQNHPNFNHQGAEENALKDQARFDGNRDRSESNFGGGDHSFGGGEHNFGGFGSHGESFGQHSFGGGGHSFGGGGHSFGGGGHSFGGGGFRR